MDSRLSGTKDQTDAPGKIGQIIRGKLSRYVNEIWQVVKFLSAWNASVSTFSVLSSFSYMFRTVSLDVIELSRYATRVQFNSSSNRFKFSTGIVYSAI